MPHPPRALPVNHPLNARSARQGFADGFTMAFQPIYDITTGAIFGHEALVRGLNGSPAATVMDRVTAHTRYSFDRKCRVKAICMAAGLGLTSRLCINAMPNAVMDPDSCIRSTQIAAAHYGFDTGKLIFEFSESDYLRSPQHLRAIVQSYHKAGFLTAIDDFGAHVEGLGGLGDLPVDFIKCDMGLARRIDSNPRKQRIAQSVMAMCDRLGIGVIVKGIESRAEFDYFQTVGARFIQGYLLNQPMLKGLHTLPRIPLPVAA